MQRSIGQRARGPASEAVELCAGCRTRSKRKRRPSRVEKEQDAGPGRSRFPGRTVGRNNPTAREKGRTGRRSWLPQKERRADRVPPRRRREVFPERNKVPQQDRR